ncbi:hypothetical protein AS200_14290 [Streptomyces sp. CdTB01]|nr:hypothetical protein AS200_14290 [Streptomyces sp. CdTB01]
MYAPLTSVPVGDAVVVHFRVHVAEGGVAGLPFEEFGWAVAALHGDVDVAVHRVAAVGGAPGGQVRPGRSSASMRMRMVAIILAVRRAALP